MTPVNDQIVQSESLEIWNCLNCRRRKVRCDRHQPCAPCLRRNLQCLFPNSGRLPHRNRISDHAKPPTRKRVELLTRLRRLEAMVGDLGSQIEYASVATDQKVDGPSDTGQDLGESSSDSSTTYVTENVDGDLVVGDPFWSIFCKEVEHIFEAVNGPAAIDLEKHMNTNPENGQRMTYYDFLRTHTATTNNSEALHPLPSQMLFLWQVFVGNIDPFIKVLHKPTILGILHRFKSGFESLENSTNALLLVIAFAAAVTLEDDEIALNFEVPKTELVSNYKSTAESALAKADIISKPDMVTLQAYAIYLGVIEHNVPPGAVWRVNGVLVRAAVSLGLHWDVARVQSLPLATELQRRLWWQICLLDSSSRSTPVTEFSISEGTFNTNLPSNINDESLQEYTQHPPDNMKGHSDTSIFVLRCEIWRFCQNLRKDMVESSPWILIASLQHFRSSIQMSYLLHLKTETQLHRFVHTTTRLFLNRIEFAIHIKNNSANARSKLFPNDRNQALHDEKVIELSISIIEDIHDLQHDPNWNGWRWQIKGRQPPWRCLHSVLNELRKSQEAAAECDLISKSDYDRALLAVRQSLASTPEEFRKESPFQQLSRLLSIVEQRKENNVVETASSANISSTTLEELHEPSLTLPVLNDTSFDTAFHIGSDPTSSWNPYSEAATSQTAGNDPDFSFTLDLDDQSWDQMGMDFMDGATTWDLFDFDGL